MWPRVALGLFVAVVASAVTAGPRLNDVTDEPGEEARLLRCEERIFDLHADHNGYSVSRLSSRSWTYILDRKVDFFVLSPLGALAYSTALDNRPPAPGWDTATASVGVIMARGRIGTENHGQYRYFSEKSRIEWNCLE